MSTSSAARVLPGPPGRRASRPRPSRRQPALASSHNEAPFTSKNPSLDNTDFYFFRDPNEPTRVNLVLAPRRPHRAAGRAELRVVPGRRLVRHQDRQQRGRGRGRDVPVHVQDDVQAAGHVPVCAARRHDDQRPEPPRHADLLPRPHRRSGVESARRQRDPASHGSARPPAEHRTQDDPELPRAPERNPDGRERPDPGRRRPAAGPVLRRPRDGLRRREPRDGTGPRPAGRRRRRHGRWTGHALRLHRPHDDAPGPDLHAHVHGRPDHRPDEPGGDPRRVVDRQHPLQPHDRRRRHRHELGRVPAGLAARQSPRERGPRGCGTQGRVERLGARAGSRLQGRRDDPRRALPDPRDLHERPLRHRGSARAAWRPPARALSGPSGERGRAPRRLPHAAPRRGLFGPASPEHRGRADSLLGREPARLLRRRPGRVPERPPHVRRRCRHRAARRGRAHRRRPADDRRWRPEVRQAPNSQLGDGVDDPQRGCRYFFPYTWSPTSAFAALHAGPAEPTHTPQIRGIRDGNVKGFPEGISDEEFAERVRIARDREDLARIQATKDAR